MIRLIADEKNIIKVVIESFINIEGFRAILSLGGITKTIDSLEKGRREIVFQKEEMAYLPKGRFYADLKVYDKDGDFYMAALPEFEVVEIPPMVSGPSIEVDGCQTLHIDVITKLPLGVPEDHSGEYVKHSDFAGIQAPYPTINANNDAIGRMLTAAKGEA